MKEILILIAILTLFGGCTIALAHGIDEVYKTLNVREPSILPGSSFYFVKEIGRKIKLFFAFSAVKKAELELRIADEKLAEFEKLASQKPEAKDALGRAFQNYLDAQHRLQSRLESLKGTNKNVDAFLEKLADRISDHQELFDDLGNKVSTKKAEEAVAQTIDMMRSGRAVNTKKFNEFLAKRTGQPPKEKEEEIARCGPMPLRATPEGCTGPICKSDKWEFECPPPQESAPPKEKPRAQKCVVGGCSGELCQSADKSPLASICIYTEKYACYKQARCEIQTNGKCGWTKTPEFNACVEKITGKETPAVPPPPAPRPPPVTPPEVKPITKEFAIEADDIAFYPPTPITVAKNTLVTITFVVRSTNIYYGGLDFRSPKFNTEPIKPGGSTVVQFTADTSFTITSYWPASGVKKADLKVEVQ